MIIESSIPAKDHNEKTNRLAEVFDLERQLWKYVHLRGLLNADVQNLYRKACSLYEKLLLGNNELDEVQEIEYSLWKLHYKHIDEFRKQTSQNSGKEDTEPSKNHENVLKGFKLFLRGSSTFYQDLIGKMRRHYDFQADQTALRKCQFLCHHLLVRLGDLARYLEVHEKPGIQKNWSVAAKHYLEAAKMYPDGGNPHNQLAWLATYVGDEFLALYHCIRSLAVKEPFPDASNNLAVIFERSQSTHINLLSSEAQFDFLKPSERVVLLAKMHASDGASDCNALRDTQGICSIETYFWPLIVRITSFFFLEYSLESFSCTFGSTIRALEALLAHDDVTLSSTLESYQNVNLSRPGPYRSLQFVSVLIFTIQNLCKTPESDSLKLQMAFAVTYIIMGRVLERCLKSVSVDKSPLLPAVLVFSEWLLGVLDKVVKIEMKEKLASAMSYFFSLYVQLLNRLVDCQGEVTVSDHVTLWEDYEMRGYTPISLCHLSLGFSAHRENKTNFRAKNECRVHRIIQAAIKLANCDSQRWILYEKGGKFCKWFQTKTIEMEEKGGSDSEQNESHQLSKLEEEEDIVFKPITRYSSAPLPAYLTKKGISQESNARGLDSHTTDESLRRASSLLIAQNRALIGAMTSSTAITMSSAHRGPPSLSAWVLNDERIGNIGESFLKPIDEIASENLSSLSLNNQDERFDFVSSAGEASTSTEFSSYCPPIPSAPLLPEDATWLSEPKASSFIHHSPSMLGPATLAPEWLLLRKENQDLHHWSNNHYNGTQQHEYFAAPWYGGNIYIQEASSRFDIVDGWGYPVIPIQPMYTENIPPLRQTSHHVNGSYDQRRETVLFQHNSDHERTAPYMCGTVTDARADEQQLLQYLKEKEMKIQQDAQLMHSTYPRN